MNPYYTHTNHLINCPDLAKSELQLSVNLSPIGGFRGNIGTVEIQHGQGKKFEDWSHKNLEDLAKVYNQILTIHEQNNIRNTLVFGKQENGQFSMSFIPYPHCNLTEKFQGLWHTIFGAPSLSDLEARWIKAFYENAFVSSYSQKSPIPSTGKRKKEGKDSEKKIDPFCKDAVINRQKILDYMDYKGNGRNYTILYDNVPKGGSRNDPHFLIIPAKEAGHVDGSSVPTDQRQHMLQIAQKAMHAIPSFGTILYLERNGSDLRGVQHQHIHIIGIRSFPRTLLEKIAVVIRQLLLWLPFIGKLSDNELKKRIHQYQGTLRHL